MKISKEITMYIIFGILTTLVSWGGYALFVNACGFSVFVANLLSWICAVLFAYVTNKLWVFDSKSWELKVIAKEVIGFFASRGITGAIEIIAVPLIAKTGFDNVFYAVAEKLGISINLFFTDGIYSKVVIAVAVVILNYVFSKLIVFKKKEND